jgi:aminocarboxymuconate-semialdehyde decarboxylase
VAELEHVRGELRLHGVAIGTHVNGKLLSDPLLAPVFEAAQRTDTPIFVHPCGPALGADRFPAPYYAVTAGYPLDTALTIFALLFGGTLARFPRLRVCFAHGGGAFPFLLGRLRFAWEALPEARAALPKPPAEYLGAVFYDSITHSPAALRLLVETLGADRIVMGSDYPFTMGVADPVAPLRELPAPVRAAITEANALRFLGVGG